MFQATASEVSVLKALSRLSDSGSKFIEESEFFDVLRSARNDGNCAQDDAITLQTFKSALSGCEAKGFVQKSEQGGKAFYRITQDGRRQI